MTSTNPLTGLVKLVKLVWSNGQTGLVKPTLNIIELVETNVTSKERHYIVNQESNLSSFWTNAEEGKNKGSGIGAIVSSKWARHIGQVKKHSRYLLELHFFFRQLELVVFIVYIALNNQ